MTRATAFDKLAFLLLLAILFSLGIHIGKSSNDTRDTSLIITLSLERHWGEPYTDEEIFIDGKYPTRLISYDGEIITVRTEGRLLEPGYLINGAKYLSPNQPLKIYRDIAGFEGRILAIREEAG